LIKFDVVKTLFSLFLVFLFSNSLTAQAPENVLFIGNSLTYFNDMPTTFRDISNSLGKNVSVTMYAPGGTGFINHVNDPNVFDIIRNDTFDIVVLQPGTSESGGASYPISQTAERGWIIMDSVRNYSPCARIFLYEISNGIISQNDYPTYFTTQTRIKDSITKLADLMQVPMIPAGECFRAHYSSNPDLLLHNSYGDVHPNANGSYLVACAAFATIYEDSVTETLHYAGIPDAVAEYLQDIADQVVLSDKPSWRIDTFEPVADFISNVIVNEAHFTNTSLNYDTILWDFGDGESSTDENPTHVYASNGNYSVSLTVFKNGCAYALQQEVMILNLALAEQDQELIVFPNPATDNLNIVFGTKAELVVVKDVHGKVINEYAVDGTLLTLNVSAWNSGIYVLEVSGNTFAGRIKFVKQ